MIKKVFILISLFSAAVTLLSQNHEFVLNAELQNSDRNGQKVLLYKYDYNNYPIGAIDSTVVAGNKFSFKNSVPERLEIWYIEIVDDSNPNNNVRCIFIPEPGTLTLTNEEKLFYVKGGDENQKLLIFQTEILYNVLKLEEEYIAYYHSKEGDSVSQNFEKKIDDIKKDMATIFFNYIKLNISNGVGEFLFINQYSVLSPSQQKDLYNQLNDEAKEYRSINIIATNNGWSNNSLSEGDKFEGIDLMTLNGKTENIADYIGKGKVVLIDFWATWCGPCRKEMPNIVSLYNKYKDSGFEIIGISLDNDEDSWKNGVANLNMTWPQFSDLGGWKGKAATSYQINRIPQTFLLDRDGTIVAVDLREESLENKIEELLKGK